MTDTICAIATGRGGAIGTIRVSGSEAITITDKIFFPHGQKALPLAERKAYTLAFGRIKDAAGETVDDVVVSIFRAPHSYTGENSTEISCHASAYILQRVMQLLADNGCRQAGPGEFTRRAFLNGKMDLSQAEAVADLIASSSAAAHRVALNQMRGNFSRELATLREKLLHLTTLMELELDFSDHEELEFADRTELDATAAQIESAISRLTSSFTLGNAIKNGIPVAIVGETNTGKSTLLNALVGEDRAIVSDIRGTTRDVIEDTVNIDGTIFRFIDTAGIRDTTDTIERLGIDRTFLKIKQADIIIWLTDATDTPDRTIAAGRRILPLCKGKQLIIARNKTDLAPQAAPLNLSEAPTDTTTATPDTPTNTPAIQAGAPAIQADAPAAIRQIAISAKHGTNIEALRHLLTEAAGLPQLSATDVIVTNARHYEALTKALNAITRVRAGLSSGLPTDLISQDLRDCLNHLSEITGGEITTDEVLQNIFTRFCVGK